MPMSSSANATQICLSPKSSILLSSQGNKFYPRKNGNASTAGPSIRANGPGTFPVFRFDALLPPELGAGLPC